MITLITGKPHYGKTVMAEALCRTRKVYAVHGDSRNLTPIVVGASPNSAIIIDELRNSYAVSFLFRNEIINALERKNVEVIICSQVLRKRNFPEGKVKEIQL